MKKKITKMAALAMAMVLIVCTFAVTASASTNSRTVYYPSSGNTSGYYFNEYKSSVCKFDSLPLGIMEINYFLSDANQMELRFYRNANLTGGYVSVNLINTHGTTGTSGHTTITLPGNGTFYVVVYSTNNVRKDFCYAYDLYRDN